MSIKNWLPDDKPREKLIKNGASSLSNAELIAILLSTGTSKHSAIDVAKQLLKTYDNNLSTLGRLTIDDFKQIKGIGQAKAVKLLAALELGRRRIAYEQERIQIKSPNDAANLFFPYMNDLPHEEFWAIYLNNANLIISKELITKGTDTSTTINITEIVRNAILKRAKNIIVLHNHPSGLTNPSNEDIQITSKLKKALSFFDINLLDHIIIGTQQKFYSFSNENTL